MELGALPEDIFSVIKIIPLTLKYITVTVSAGQNNKIAVLMGKNLDYAFSNFRFKITFAVIVLFL